MLSALLVQVLEGDALTRQQGKQAGGEFEKKKKERKRTETATMEGSSALRNTDTTSRANAAPGLPMNLSTPQVFKLSCQWSHPEKFFK